MKEKTQKIIFSAASLILSFIIPIEIVNIILLLLSSLTLLEETIKNAIPLIKRREWSLPPILLVVLAIILVYLREYRLLLIFLLFYHIKEYLFLLLLDKNRKKILETLQFEEKMVSLKTVTGLVKAKWRDIKVGDVIYLNVGEVCYTEGILLSKSLIYETPYGHQKKSIVEGELIPSGAFLSETAMVKVVSPYRESKLYQMIHQLEEVKKTETVTSGKELETKYHRLLWMFGFLIVLASIFLFKQNGRTILLMLTSFLALLSITSIPSLLEATYFMSLVKLLKKDIYCLKDNILEKINQIETVVFSKTGLFTSGELTLTKVIPVYQTKEEVVRYATLTETGSLHPIAKALRRVYQEEVLPEQIYLAEDIKGKGRHANIEGKDIYLGNYLLFEELGINVPKIDFPGTTVLLAIDGDYVATFVFSYEVKDNTYLTSSLLREEGIKKVSLISSGETEQIKKIGSYLSMNESFASLTLEDKIEVLKMYQKEANTMLVDWGNMNSELTHYVALSLLCEPREIPPKVDVILLDNNLENVVYLKKEANIFEKIQKGILSSYFALKTLVFILVACHAITLDILIFLFLLYDFGLILSLMNRLKD